MTRRTKDSDNSKTAKNPSIITLDYDLYAHYLDGADLTEEQKQEFLETLWSIVCEFVALGFEVHPAQQAKNACGELLIQLANPSDSKADAIELNNRFLQSDFDDAAAGNASQAERRIPR